MRGFDPIDPSGDGRTVPILVCFTHMAVYLRRTNFLEVNRSRGQCNSVDATTAGRAGPRPCNFSLLRMSRPLLATITFFLLAPAFSWTQGPSWFPAPGRSMTWTAHSREAAA